MVGKTHGAVCERLFEFQVSCREIFGIACTSRAGFLSGQIMTELPSVQHCETRSICFLRSDVFCRFIMERVSGEPGPDRQRGRVQVGGYLTAVTSYP